VLDLGIGKGGDMHKWHFEKIACLVGVDIAEKSLIDCWQLAVQKEFSFIGIQSSASAPDG